MGLNLRGVWIKVETQLFDKVLSNSCPVNIGVSRKMCIIVTHRAIDLAQQWYAFNLNNLALQAVSHIGYLFAHGGGRSGLAMGTRQHRDIGELSAHRTELIDNHLQLGQHDLITSFFEHQRMR